MQRGVPFHSVEDDGDRSCTWVGTDRAEALAAAIGFAEGGPVAVDLTRTTFRPLPAGVAR